jgi:hypothetical protein
MKEALVPSNGLRSKRRSRRCAAVGIWASARHLLLHAVTFMLAMSEDAALPTMEPGSTTNWSKVV